MDFIVIIFSVISVPVALGMTILFLFQKYQSKQLRKNIMMECIDIAEQLGQVAFGYLDARMESTSRRIPGAPEIEAGIRQIRKNFNDITNEPIRRVCYVGTDAWLEGSECATIIGEKLEGEGKVAVLVTSSLRALIMAQRQRSFVTNINLHFSGITVVETYEAQANQDNAASFVKRMAGQVDAIYITGNSAAAGAARGLEESGFVGKVYLLCHDLDGNIAGFIRKKSISASLVCSTISQGRDPVIHLFNHIAAGWKPIQPRLFIPLDLVDSDTIEQFWDFSDNTLLEAKKPKADAVQPHVKSAQPLRFVVFLDDWNNAFLQMKAGVQMAAELIKPYNASVSIHAINQLKRPKDEVVSEVEAILAKEQNTKIDGIIAFVGSADLVPVLNRQVDKGIPVATFDSEPLGLRSMVMWLAKSSIELGRFSSEYMIGHQEINTSIQEILRTLNEMVGRVTNEADTAKEGVHSVNNLMGLINNTVTAEETQLQTVSSSYVISSRLAEMVEFFNEKISGLKKVGSEVNRSREKISSMSDFNERILTIISIIDDIAQQTNLLALNAAIEAARAGVSGKGFEIIAHEIRNLADRSTSSTRDVESLITEMRTAIEESVGAIGQTKTIVDEQIDSITAASEQMNNLSEQLFGIMEQVQGTVEQNTQKILKMKDSAFSMNALVEKSSVISADNSLAIETLSSNFTEISTQFNEMNNQTKLLGDIVNVLHHTVAQFNAD
ncbi:MAG: substrate-binding domain-containing protein [Spirochaetales bacterium]|nr:substrate-binding domain-containing protein [Spirochaetales bacterium]